MEPQTVSETHQLRLRASMHANALLLVLSALFFVGFGFRMVKAHTLGRLGISMVLEMILFLWAAWLFRVASLEPIPYQEAVSLAAANVGDAVAVTVFVLTNPFKFFHLTSFGQLCFLCLAFQGLIFGAIQYYLLRNDVFRYTAILV